MTKKLYLLLLLVLAACSQTPSSPVVEVPVPTPTTVANATSIPNAVEVTLPAPTPAPTYPAVTISVGPSYTPTPILEIAVEEQIRQAVLNTTMTHVETVCHANDTEGNIVWTPCPEPNVSTLITCHDLPTASLAIKAEFAATVLRIQPEGGYTIDGCILSKTDEAGIRIGDNVFHVTQMLVADNWTFPTPVETGAIQLCQFQLDGKFPYTAFGHIKEVYGHYENRPTFCEDVSPAAYRELTWNSFEYPDNMWLPLLVYPVTE